VTFVSDIIDKFLGLNKPLSKFLADVFNALMRCPERATMTNLARFGAGSPRRIARWFSRPFDWPEFNLHALKDQGVLQNDLVVCIDATFLPKSGQHTWGLAHFHNGVTGRCERGCEAVSLGLLDLDETTAYSLHICQTPATFSKDEDTRVNFQLECLESQAKELLAQDIKVVVGDGFYAKKKFTTIVRTVFQNGPETRIGPSQT